jgi:hypothetical protein
MTSFSRAYTTKAVLVALCLGAGCAGDDDGSDDGADSGSADDDGADDADDVDADDDDSADADAGDDEPGDDDSADDDSGNAGEVIYEESFDGSDGDGWPDPWQVVGTHIIDAEIDGGRGRMSGQTNLTARIALPGEDEVDTDVTVVVEYENFAAQGYGFYVRHNGGALQETDPPGQGYGVYAEGSVLRSLGVWKEIGGVESPILETPDAVPGGVESGTPYVIRFQCQQREGSTLLRAKMWRQGDDEPGEWMVETEDSTPELQNTSGSFANDVYNYSGTGSVWVHDVEIARL